MIRVMTFIDGSWLNGAIQELVRNQRRTDFQIDFSRLSEAAAEAVFNRGFRGRVDLVRTYYFGAFADNCDERDLSAAQKRRSFFARLAETPGFDVESLPVDFRGRRLRGDDRDPDDRFTPDERVLDVALSARVMQMAVTPGAMDVALMLVGGARFVPLLQQVRQMGRRVAIASIHGRCDEALFDPGDARGVRDFDIVWLDDILGRAERRRPRQFRRQEPVAAPAAEPGGGETLKGTVKNIIWDRGYGFIAATDGRDYFFHANALEGEFGFDDLQPDMEVELEVKTSPTAERAGAAARVWPDPERQAPGDKNDLDEDEGDFDDEEDYEDEYDDEEEGEDEAGEAGDDEESRPV